MGFFNMGANKQRAPQQYVDPALSRPSTWQDKLMLIGATMKDVGSSVEGRPADNIMTAQQILASRGAALKSQKDRKALLEQLGLAPPPPSPTAASPGMFMPGSVGGPSQLGGLGSLGSIGPASPLSPTPPPPPPLSLQDPRIQRALAMAEFNGVQGAGGIATMLGAAAPSVQVATNGEAYNSKDAGVIGHRFGDPTVANGFLFDKNDPQNLGRYFPQSPVNGALPTYDAQGAVSGFNLPQSSSNAMAAGKAAEAAGQALGAAPYTPDNRTNASGAPVYGVQADRFSGGGVGGLVGQSPADNVTETTDARLKAEASGGAQVNLPQALAQADQTLALIGQIKTHPGLASRTGMLGGIPSVPGTKGADFDAMTSQLRGKVYLEAYSSLKGAGAITDNEGKVATAAIARLNQSQTKEGFLSALGDLENVIKSGADRMRTKASGGQSGPSRDAVAVELRRRGLIK